MRLSSSLILSFLMTATLPVTAFANPKRAGGSTKAAKPDKELIERSLTLLERGTKAGDFDIRALSVWGLGFGPKARTQVTVKDALADPQWRVRAASIEGLRNLGDVTWEKELAKSTCSNAIDALSTLAIYRGAPSTKAAPMLVSALGTKDCAQPERYPFALARGDDEWFLATFRTALKSKVDASRLPFEAELLKLPLEKAEPLLKEHFTKLTADQQHLIVSKITKNPLAIKDISFIKPALKSSNAQLAFDTAAVLASRQDTSGKALLVEALKSTDATKRRAALAVIKPIADEPIFERMREIIRDRSTSYEELVAAYDVYSAAGSAKLQSYLEKELNSTDIPQRAAAVRFIGRVKGQAALPDLHAILVNSPKEVRLAALGGIGEVASRQSIPELSAALARETDRELKLAMLNALGSMKDAEAISATRFYLRDSDAGVREAAVDAIIGTPDKSAIKDLELAATDRVKEVREKAIIAIIELDPKGQLPLFTKALEWLDAVAFDAFVSRHGDNALAHIEIGLNSTRPDIRSTALSAARHLSKAGQVQLLAKLAKPGSAQQLRLVSLERLVSLQGAETAPFLTELLSDSDDKVRVFAIKALSDLGQSLSTEQLTQLLDSPSEHVRAAAAAALLRI